MTLPAGPHRGVDSTEADPGQAQPPLHEEFVAAVARVQAARKAFSAVLERAAALEAEADHACCDAEDQLAALLDERMQILFIVDGRMLLSPWPRCIALIDAVRCTQPVFPEGVLDSGLDELAIELANPEDEGRIRAQLCPEHARHGAPAYAPVDWTDLLTPQPWEGY